ncbi:MAG: hypothetical protein ABIR96_02460 [Bdellovibrionota bacterium]
MDALPDLHLSDLSEPRLGWLERLLGFKDLKEAVHSTEGPPIFAKVASIDELRLALGLQSTTKLSLLKTAHTQLPEALLGLGSIEFSNTLELWTREFAAIPDALDTVLLVYLQNPQLLDGVTLHPEICSKLLRDLDVVRKKFLRVVVISDETLGAFCWDAADDPVQMARMPAAAIADWDVFVAFRPETLLGPHAAARAPLLLWPASHSKAAFDPKLALVASPVAWKLLQRDLNQGIEIVRFRHLALRNLKTLANALAPLLQSGKIHVDHWPLSGLYFTLRLGNRGHEDPELLAKRIEHQGVKTHPHPLQPGHVSFCYVLDNADLRRGLERLNTALELL